MHRGLSTLLFFAVVWGVAPAMSSSAKGNVTGVSISETANARGTQYSTYPPTGPGTDVQDSHSVGQLPPTSVSATVVTCGASATVSSYSGPAAPGDLTADLSLVGSVYAHYAWMGAFQPYYANTNFVYSFALDNSQPYTWTCSSTGKFGSPALPVLTGPGGIVPAGNGILVAGAYQLSASAGVQFTTFEDWNSASYNLSITPAPEPATALLLIPTALIFVVRRSRAD